MMSIVTMVPVKPVYMMQKGKESSTEQSSSLLECLIPYWQDYQLRVNENVDEIGRQEDETFVAVTKIRRALDLYLQDRENYEDEIESCLIHFFSCAICSVAYSQGCSDDDGDKTILQVAVNSNAISRVLLLSAAVVASDAVSIHSCKATLIHCAKFASVDSSDAVRFFSCQFIGNTVEQILLREIHGSKTRGLSEYNEILDIASQTLLPRFTDKSQLVRMAAINAGSFFFKDEKTDPDILMAMLWSLQHDPSVANRQNACKVIPMNLETIDYLIPRVRDVNPKVRCAALERLQEAFELGLLDPQQAAAIVEFGWTKRCSLTKSATMRMICIGWLRSCELNPLELLKKVNVCENEQACSIVFQALHDALGFFENSSSMESIKDELSEHEIARFYLATKNALSLSLEYNVTATVEHDLNVFLSPEQLFAVNSVLKLSKDSSYNETLLAQLIPDVPTLCYALERHASALVQSIQEKNQAKEVELTFICVHLLRLAVHHQSCAMEEGSRRVFSAAMKEMLTNILTPDDLIENCVEALNHFENWRPLAFIQQIGGIVSSLNERTDEIIELKGNYTIRLIMILSASLEFVNSTDAKQSQELFCKFTAIIEPNIEAHAANNALAQEAAVSCLGKLGLLMEPSKVNEKYYPLLLSVVRSHDLPISVRVQAMLALHDFSILLKNKDTEFCAIVSTYMNHASFSVRCIAAEVATKFLFAGRVDDSINSDWLATLVILFFGLEEFCTDTCDSDVAERGSPVRLQQLLSTFFPALCVRSQDGQDALMGAITPMLLIGSSERATHSITDPSSSSRKSSKKSSRKDRRVKNLPITRMVEFICSNVQIGEEMFAKKSVDRVHNDDCSEEVPESSPLLIASIQVAEFLSKNVDSYGMANVRSLCKLLGGLRIDESKEACKHLLMLKEATEELYMQLEDETCIKYIGPLNKQLDAIEIVDVESDSDVSIHCEKDKVQVENRCKKNVPPIIVDLDENIPGIYITPKNATMAITKETRGTRRALLPKTPN